MKRRITLSIALVMSIVLVSLMSSDSTVKAQNQIRIVANTGIVLLGDGQFLRVTLTGGEVHNDGEIYGISFRQMNYIQNTCIGGVCKLAISSQTISPVTMLESDEAASFDIQGQEQQHGVRVVVLSNSQKVQVNASIIDIETGKIVSSWATFPNSY